MTVVCHWGRRWREGFTYYLIRQRYSHPSGPRACGADDHRGYNQCGRRAELLRAHSLGHVHGRGPRAHDSLQLERTRPSGHHARGGGDRRERSQCGRRA